MMETLLIAGACIVTIFVGFYVHLRWSMRFIAEQMEMLDAKLAEALTSTIQNLPIGDIPEVNPVQMMIMQLIQDNMKPKTITAQVRDEAGLFTGAESES